MAVLPCCHFNPEFPMSYYISPRFLDKVAIHITKNFLEIPGVKVPLILGIHGRKGEGKTFQCELVFEKMGIEVIRMSAGELESPDAGDPARLIRLRYREAAELIRVRGKMCVLLINDFDAGAGRFDGGTQYTVNTQLVHGTLMNIADRPTDVQLPGSYDATPLHPVPIILTGNDFSTLYAPLIRDGRMEKFYWEPDRSDKIGIVGGIFDGDGLSPAEIEKLVDTFSDGAIDFFSALRARLYDEQIRSFIHDVGVNKISSRIVNSTDRPPEFRQPNFSLPHLIEVGNLMVRDNEQVYKSRLVEEYMPHRYGISHQEAQEIVAKAVPSVEVPPPVRQIPQPDAWQSDRQYASRPVEESRPYRYGVSSNDAQAIVNNAVPSVEVHAPVLNTIVNEPIPEVLQSSLSQELESQILEAVDSGYKLALECADDRRFKTSAWQSCGSIHTKLASEALSEVANCLAEHPREYIRLIAIDPNLKRRIKESIIQRPA